MLRAVLALRLREPKIQKSKTFLRGPKLLDFFIFLRFFWFLSEIKKHMVLFGFPTEIKKKLGFFGFSPEIEQENQKNPVFFGFPPRIQKKIVILWISVGKLKNPRKTKKSKSFGPLRKVLDFFWFPPKALQTKHPKPF